jgi:alpha-L-fucosidase
MKLVNTSRVALAVLCGANAIPPTASAETPAVLSLRLRRLAETQPGSDQWRLVETTANWNARDTAVVICDMWNQHWCQGATARVAEMAPRMNQVISALRQRGVLIIHCPSDCMAFYQDTPQRKLAQSAPKVDLQEVMRRCLSRVPEKEPPLPIDDSDGGCNDSPQCQQGSPWTHEIDTLEIKPGDAITDSAEAYYLMHERGITNVIIMGVHENMCVLGRPFAIRQMVKLGQNVVLIRDLTDTMYNSRQRPWVDHFTGTDLVCWHIEKYWCPTITSDQILGGQPFRFAADTKPPRVFPNYVKVPQSNEHWKRVASYVEETPQPDYQQAPEAAREAFRDLKFGVRIHWGVYAIWQTGESWPFLGLSDEKRQEYQELYRQFNPTNFNADGWMELFKTNGVKVFAFTSKHHDGFSMFDTHTRVRERVNWTAPGGPRLEQCDVAYSVMESPFHRDIVKELCDAAHRHGVKIDLYFSHPDWYDADFRPYAFHPVQVRDGARYGEEPGETKRIRNPLYAPDPTPAEVARMMARHRAQLTELLTRYGKIDLMCLDQWLGPAVWPQLRATMKYLRTLQPDVMFRARGIGNYGDYYTPEGFVPGAKENTAMPWMVIYPLGGMWSYQPDASKYHGGDWIVKNLVDIVAKGGNFMVGIGPDATGLFHPKAVEALQYAGAWLRVNGEAIFATRPRPGNDWKEGDAIRFTRTKDGRFIYAISLRWPGEKLVLKSVHPRPGSEITMLGLNTPLPWHSDNAGLVIELPARLQDPANRPCVQAYTFKIEDGDPHVKAPALD